MAYCYKCGAEIPEDSNFCPKCGYDLKNGSAVSTDLSTDIDSEISTDIVVETEVINESTDIYDTEPERSDYYIILSSVGSCPASYADDVISDVLGYSSLEAKNIVRIIPTEIAANLTAIQALYIAQALSEYGMSVAVYNSDGYTDIGLKAGESVYNSDGSLKEAVLAVLGTLTAANLLRTFTKWKRLIDIRHLFRPSYHRAPPSEWRRPRPVMNQPRRTIDPASVHRESRTLSEPRRSEPGRSERHDSHSPRKQGGPRGNGPGRR